MDTVNGKLLGNSEGDSDRTSQELYTINQDLDEIKQYLNQLEQRYRQLEVVVDIKHRQQIQTYEQELQLIRSPIKQIAGRITILEKRKLTKVEANLSNLERQIPPKIFWLGFYSSLVFGFISMWNWFEIHPLDESIVRNTNTPETLVRESSRNSLLPN